MRKENVPMKQFFATFLCLILMFFAGCAKPCETCGGGELPCEVCGGTAVCGDCDASGNHICPRCDGNPECFFCEDGSCPDCGPGWTGMANPKCRPCDGSGRCYACDGRGIIQSFSDQIPDWECFECHSTGMCRECRGTGRGELKAAVCGKCGGSEICKYCNGTHLMCTDCSDGRIPCPSAGECTDCGGSGHRDCPNC